MVGKRSLWFILRFRRTCLSVFLFFTGGGTGAAVEPVAALVAEPVLAVFNRSDADGVAALRPPGFWQASWPTLLELIAALVAAAAGLVAVLLVRSRSRRREEEALRLQRDVFVRTMRNATVSRFASVLAHELTQPLAALVSNAGAAARVLDRSGSPAPELKEMLRDIVDAAHRAGEIMSSVRSLVCRDTGGSRTVMVNQLVSGVLSTLSPEAKSRGCTLAKRLSPRMPEAVWNATQIQQVVVNLVMNAMDAATMEGIKLRRVDVSTARDGPGHVTISVRDYGPGLPPEGGEQWFEEFYSTKPGGMGVGLAISRDIVESHEGTLQACAARGGGSLLVLRLPLKH